LTKFFVGRTAKRYYAVEKRLQNASAANGEMNTDVDVNRLVRLIAFYLPQFHPIPENNQWWGNGFTEWTNVTKARPLFREHYQPHLPADLGFYDLRLPEVRQAQADLARQHGIYGFCYWHYWFNGRRLLERPFCEVLASGQPDFPFCLCWANENWTGNLNGCADQVLVKQEYSEQDDIAHIHWLAQAFRDKRYIRHNGKPLFLVYRANALPDSRHTTSVWREQARMLGIGELFLVCVEAASSEKADPSSMGFDAAVEFQPEWGALPRPARPQYRQRLMQRLGLATNGHEHHAIIAYSAVVEKMIRKPNPPYRRFPCVTPSWDNSARKHCGGIILHGSRPEEYERWLRSAIERECTADDNERFVFVNAWNEWAEGNHLEPDIKWGRQYLERTGSALESCRQLPTSLSAQSRSKT
jgi:lipopolysaccharide biosynthesis protein